MHADTRDLDTPARLRDIADLPGPRAWPLLGNAPQIDAARLHQQLEGWAADHGPFFRLRIGPRRILVVAEHGTVAGVLRDRPDGFRRTVRLEEIWLELGLPPGLFGANGEAWVRQRRMVMAAFAPANVKRYYPALQRVAGRLADRWQRAAAAGEAVPLQADLMRYTVDTIAGLAFGSAVDTLGSDDDVIQRHLDKIFPALSERLLAPLPTWRWLPGRRQRALAAAVREVLAAVDGFIAAARAELEADPALREAPANLLQAMLVAAAEPGNGIADEAVAGNVLTMLLAGEDTTAHTLAWMIHLLWRHPAALALARAEVRRVCGDGSAPPTLEQLAALDHVEACCHETMRLKPVAPLLPLQALRDTVLGDVRVPAGQIVLNLMRRDAISESFFQDAGRFEPARWLEGGSAAAASAKRISMPFGAGPRICPGRFLALLEMKMAMATLLSRFEILAVNVPGGGGSDGEAAERLAFTMAPAPLTMRLAPRAPH